MAAAAAPLVVWSSRMNLRGVATTALIALVVTVAYQKYGAGAGMRRGA